MIDSEEPSTLITFEHNVFFNRFIYDKLLATHVNFKAIIFPLVDEISEEEFDTTLSKVKFWLEAIVSKCIIFSKNNPVASRLFVDMEKTPIPSNLFMTTPSEPVDELIAMLFQTKLTALSGSKIAFTEATVKSNNFSDLTFTFVGETGDIFPSHQEWVGDRSYFDKSWWDRDDASTFDIIPPDDADLTVKPKWAYTLDFLNAEMNKPDSSVVLGFKPTVIDGGQK